MRLICVLKCVRTYIMSDFSGLYGSACCFDLPTIVRGNLISKMYTSFCIGIT